MIVYTASGAELHLNPKPFGKGAEGSVYRILDPISLSRECVKIYHNTQTTANIEKIKAMAANPPNTEHMQSCICWPTTIVYKERSRQTFLGYMMPMALLGSESLYTLIVAPNKMPWSHKLDRDTPRGLRYFLSVAHNTALLIRAIQMAGDKLYPQKGYVIGDLKPENILVDSQALISFIDMDSIQIYDGRTLYPAATYSEEYAPPELTKHKGVHSTHSHDFILAMVIYRLLFGVNPYMCTVHGKDGLTINNLKEQGYYAHGRKSSEIINIPYPHRSIVNVRKDLRDMFMLAFDIGLYDPSQRPTASDWAQALYVELQKNKFIQ